MNTNLSKNNTIPEIFECKTCDYVTDKLYNWNKHISTSKHLKMCSIICNTQGKYLFTCELCGKQYKHRTSLSRHHKHCDKNKNSKIELTDNEYTLMKNKAEMYDKQKNDIEEMKELLDTVVKNTSKNNNIITNTINNNINVNIILETKCAEAISLADFSNHLNLTLEDLFYTKANGYIEGVSNVFIKKLNELKPTERPIQCNDKKGNVIYVKAKDEWEKDDNGKVLDTHISEVSKKQVDILKLWEEAHPNWQKSDEETKTYMELIEKIMGGVSDKERTKNHKLIQKKISQNCKISDIIDV